MLYLGLSTLLVTAVCVGVFHYLQRQRLETRIVGQGYSYLDSFIQESRDSITKGQPHTFQQVVDNVARIDEIAETALYSNYGLMTYRSGVRTVGIPFAFDAQGQFVNPNEKIYEDSRGRYRRSDWSIRDLTATPSGQAHVNKYQAQACTDCHFGLDQRLSFAAGDRAHIVDGARAEFFQRLPVARGCVDCHTNWKEGDPAGYLKVGLNTEFARREQAENFRGLLLVLASVLSPAALLMLAVFRFLVYRPIYRLVDSIDDLTHRDGDLTKRLDDRGNNEMSLLSGLFNQFMHKIHAIVVAIKGGMAIVYGSANQLATQSAEILENNNQVADNLDRIAVGAQQMQSSVGSVVAAISAIQANVGGIVEVIDRTNASASDNNRSTAGAMHKL
jgi:hypothetical protein